MPISKIEVNEYTCAWCDYKWINRVNGKDRPIPEKCAKCKRSGWINGRLDIMTPKEIGLRRRINGFNEVYRYHSSYFRWRPTEKEMAIDWPSDLSKKFLSIQPRPTMQELKQVMYPLGWDAHKHKDYVPDPDRPGYLKYDLSQWIPDPTPDKPGRMKRNLDYSTHEYRKLVKQEAQKRIDSMVEIIKSRGIDYDLPAGIAQTQQKYNEEDSKPKKSYAQMIEELTGHPPADNNGSNSS